MIILSLILFVVKNSKIKISKSFEKRLIKENNQIETLKVIGFNHAKNITNL